MVRTFQKFFSIKAAALTHVIVFGFFVAEVGVVA